MVTLNFFLLLLLFTIESLITIWEEIWTPEARGRKRI